jgi:ElaB/YqjD/DUF883 family membrane-anchored ribosome-binding protein
MERTAEIGAALAHQLRNVLQLTEELLQALSDDRDEAVRVLRDRVYSAIDGAKAAMADTERRAQETTRRAAVAADVYVREHPWTTVSLGAAVGLVLGSWLLQDRRPVRRREVDGALS